MNVVGTISDRVSRRKKNAVEVLESMLARAKAGEVLSVAIVADLEGGNWITMNSGAEDGRVLSAMLIELGMRGLGLGQREP